MTQTLRAPDNELNSEQHMPYSSLCCTFLKACSLATPASLVGFVVLIQFQVLCHCDQVNYRHPGSIVVTSFWNCFPGLE